jgi:hypothetical protein
MNGLLETLARRWNQWWGRERREDEPDRPGDRRRRFWSEFREGQRQAEETSSTNAGRTRRPG